MKSEEIKIFKKSYLNLFQITQRLSGPNFSQFEPKTVTQVKIENLAFLAIFLLKLVKILKSIQVLKTWNEILEI